MRTFSLGAGAQNELACLVEFHRVYFVNALVHGNDAQVVDGPDSEVIRAGVGDKVAAGRKLEHLLCVLMACAVLHLWREAILLSPAR